MPLNVFNVDLLGPAFAIQTDESLDYMQALVMRLKERLTTLKDSTKVTDPLRLSVLLNITLIDELQRAREKYLEGGPSIDARDEEFASIAARLIASLDKSLEPVDAGDEARPVLAPDEPDTVH